MQMKEPQSEIQAKQEKKGGVMDEVFLNLFRKKMVEEVGWDSGKPGYDGLIEVANRLMLRSPTNSHTKEAAVHTTLLSFFGDLFTYFLEYVNKKLYFPADDSLIHE